jgi:hypothetical protein
VADVLPHATSGEPGRAGDPANSPVRPDRDRLPGVAASATGELGGEGDVSPTVSPSPGSQWPVLTVKPGRRRASSARRAGGVASASPPCVTAAHGGRQLSGVVAPHPSARRVGDTAESPTRFTSDLCGPCAVGDHGGGRGTSPSSSDRAGGMAEPVRYGIAAGGACRAASPSPFTHVDELESRDDSGRGAALRLGLSSPHDPASDERVSLRALLAASRVLDHIGQHPHLLDDARVCAATEEVRQRLTDLDRRRAGLWWDQATGTKHGTHTGAAGTGGEGG